MPLPTRKQELKNDIDWQQVFEGFSCVMGNIWRARKFFKTDELSFSIPEEMFLRMLEHFENSFLMTNTWQIVAKKIERSRKAWGKAG